MIINTINFAQNFNKNIYKKDMTNQKPLKPSPIDRFEVSFKSKEDDSFKSDLRNSLNKILITNSHGHKTTRFRQDEIEEIISCVNTKEQIPLVLGLTKIRYHQPFPYGFNGEQIAEITSSAKTKELTDIKLKMANELSDILDNQEKGNYRFTPSDIAEITSSAKNLEVADAKLKLAKYLATRRINYYDNLFEDSTNITKIVVSAQTKEQKMIKRKLVIDLAEIKTANGYKPFDGYSIAKIAASAQTEEQAQVKLHLAKNLIDNKLFCGDSIADITASALTEEQAQVKLQLAKNLSGYKLFGSYSIAKIAASALTEEQAQVKLQLAKNLSGYKLFRGDSIAYIVASAQTEEQAQVKLQLAKNLSDDKLFDSYSIQYIAASAQTEEEAQVKLQLAKKLAETRNQTLLNPFKIVDIVTTIQSKDQADKLLKQIRIHK